MAPEISVRALRFPPGSVRRAVAVYGDAWVLVYETGTENRQLRAAIRDEGVMRHCGYLVARFGRALSAPVRADMARDELPASSCSLFLGR